MGISNLAIKVILKMITFILMWGKLKPISFLYKLTYVHYCLVIIDVEYKINYRTEVLLLMWNKENWHIYKIVKK